VRAVRIPLGSQTYRASLAKAAGHVIFAQSLACQLISFVCLDNHAYDAPCTPGMPPESTPEIKVPGTTRVVPCKPSYMYIISPHPPGAPCHDSSGHQGHCTSAVPHGRLVVGNVRTSYLGHQHSVLGMITTVLRKVSAARTQPSRAAVRTSAVPAQLPLRTARLDI
jgi:hypothetical protein